MIWSQTILPLVLGVVVCSSWQNVQAKKNKSKHNLAEKPAIVESVLYMKYACQGKQNGLRLPIEGSCTQYLECQHGSTKLMTCKNGTHFSNFGLACIDVKLSKCSVKCECCDKEDGLYPDVENCSNFIVCFEGKPHQQSCGDIFKFNADKLICDIPERTRCHTELLNSTSFIEREIKPLPKKLKTPMFMTSYRVCLNKTNGYTVGIPGSCNKFYLCINGKGHLKSCGSMQFNAATHYCDARTRILCPEFEDNDVILESEENPFKYEIPQGIDELQPPHREPGKPFPEEQIPTEIPLSPPVVGNPEHPPMPHLPEGYPRPNEAVPPTIYFPRAEEIIDPRKYAGLCANESVGALIAVPRHCNKYIRCKWDWYKRRVAELESCPKNKHFNAKSKVCDVPEKAGCVLPLN